MKRRLASLLLVFALICLAACGTETSTTDAPPVYNATVEYGEPDLITDNRGPLWAYIRFPAIAGPLGGIIEEWARGVYQSALDEVAGLRKDDPVAEGEVNVQFDSYLVDGRYAGIVENGTFSTSHLAHPGDVIRTFNIDTENGTLLQNADILDDSQVKSILSVLRDAIDEAYPDVNYPVEMDGTWLEHIAVGHDGVIVVLERSKCLPGYLGTVKIMLPYDKLGKAFILGAEPTPEPPTEPPTVPFTEPTTNPTIPNVPPQSGDIDPSKPMIALTFDDGPSKYTPQILDILEKYGCRATFCVVGNYVDARKDTVKRASDLGCEVIGHSWDHRDLSKLSAEEIKKEIDDTSAVIESATGTSPRMYRPPYGAVGGAVKSTSAELGYAMIYWSVDPEDWKTRNADAVYSAVMSHISDRAIILSHDLYGTTADAYERIISELLSKGYQLVTVSELMYYSNRTLEAGVVYYNGK